MNPLPSTEPQKDKLVLFAARLRDLRVKAGSPPLAEMARRSGVSLAALSTAHGGRKLPTWRTVDGYVRACGAQSAPWRDRWEAVWAAQQAAQTSDAQAALVKRWATTRRFTPPQWARSDIELTQALDQLRRFRGLSLRKLARRAPGFSHHTYGVILRGDRPMTADALIRILHSCEVGTGDAQRWMEALVRVRPSESLRVQELLSRVPRPRYPARRHPAESLPHARGSRTPGASGGTRPVRSVPRERDRGRQGA
ncbi:helix-turn-helix domain-containing protein [Streptomyces bacillaris]|uniref:helix-turn-helix domain-containing protein n=1 Tax=Streptomyces bacillaris TaxID=68179 RepID=UPI003465E110